LLRDFTRSDNCLCFCSSTERPREAELSGSPICLRVRARCKVLRNSEGRFSQLVSNAGRRSRAEGGHARREVEQLSEIPPVQRKVADFRRADRYFLSTKPGKAVWVPSEVRAEVQVTRTSQVVRAEGQLMRNGCQRPKRQSISYDHYFICPWANVLQCRPYGLTSVLWATIPPCVLQARRLGSQVNGDSSR
jgi:hypothetical protein